MTPTDHLGAVEAVETSELTFQSPAFDVVSAADHPSPEAGGPCATCAFRPGSEAANTPHTVWLAKLCVEGLTPFDCHERPGLCRGWIAAANLIAAAGYIAPDEATRRHREVAMHGADILAQCIASARAGQEPQR